MRLFRFDLTDFIPSSHEDPKNPGVLKKVIFSREELPQGRVQMVNWALLPVGKSFQKHYHEKMSEVFVISRGTVEFVVNGENIGVGRGDGILVEVREHHSATNIGERDAEYMCFGIVHEEGGKTVVVE